MILASNVSLRYPLPKKKMAGGIGYKLPLAHPPTVIQAPIHYPAPGSLLVQVNATRHPRPKDGENKNRPRNGTVFPTHRRLMPSGHALLYSYGGVVTKKGPAPFCQYQLGLTLPSHLETQRRKHSAWEIWRADIMQSK